jgi:[ribosomal protein S5]-alanine N-acetyltransferase
MPVSTRTQRLKLRLLRPGDFDVVHSLFSSSGHTIGDGPVTDPAWTREWLEHRQQRYQENGLAWYGLWESDGTFVGSCGAFLGRCGDEPEIGYEIDLRWRRRGYATEAVKVVTNAVHAAGHARVWATIRPANVASIRIARAVGYHFDRSEPDSNGDLDYYLSGAP